MPLKLMVGLRTILWRPPARPRLVNPTKLELSLTAAGLVELLDSYRSTHHFPIAFFSDTLNDAAGT
jgi:hypothetical protein